MVCLDAGWRFQSRARASAVSWIPWVAAEVLAELARCGYAAVVDIEVRVVLDRAE
jgi:hypothetical protein